MKIRRRRSKLRGSEGDSLGMGRLSRRPSEAMRKTLPAMSMDARFERVDEVVSACEG